MKQIIATLALLSLTGCGSTLGWTDNKTSQDGPVIDEEMQIELEVDEQSVADADAQRAGVENKELVIVKKSRLDAEQPETPRQASLAFQNDYRNTLLSNMNKTKRQQPNQARHNKDINYYVRGLMQQLVGNMQYVNTSTPVAITSFVMLDSDYQRSDILGKQIAESFIHEVHKFGIPVLDFKTTEYIRVTPQGDFILSKDYLELEGDLPIKYVVAGTMTQQLNGMLINARVIGLESKAVVASAQGFLPTAIVNGLVSSGFNDGIPVVADQGE
jgi:TolB-like protein